MIEVHKQTKGMDIPIQALAVPVGEGRILSGCTVNMNFWVSETLVIGAERIGVGDNTSILR